MTGTQLLLTVVLVALTTLCTRVAPFLLFPEGRRVPRFVAWLGGQLPRAVMVMLVVYCLKDVSFASPASWLPALAGVVSTVLAHLWRRQMILSIVCGTGVYMVLLRLLGA